MAAIIKTVVVKLKDLQTPSKRSRIEFDCQVAATTVNITAAVVALLALTDMSCSEFSIFERVVLASPVTGHVRGTGHMYANSENRVQMLAETTNPEAPVSVGIPGPVEALTDANDMLITDYAPLVTAEGALATALWSNNSAALASPFYGGSLTKKRA